MLKQIEIRVVVKKGGISLHDWSWMENQHRFWFYFESCHQMLRIENIPDHDMD
jgi:hypothetical protein